MKDFLKTVKYIGLVFLVTTLGLFAFGFIPEELRSVIRNVPTFLDFRGEASTKGSAVSLDGTGVIESDFVPIPIGLGPSPEVISIPSIGIQSRITTPSSTAVAALDAALLNGVVHFPGSGNLEDESNVLLFGHSTNWKSVNNSAYKALNRLAELRLGDQITVSGGGVDYTYTVVSVSLVSADAALINFARGKRMLTLSTCNTFGKKEERVVVEAVFKEITALPGNTFSRLPI